MGGCLSDSDHSNRAVNQNELIVATLNYCGIMQSPFEFYVDQFTPELREISELFQKTAENYSIPDFDKRNSSDKQFKWKGGKLDHWFRPHRYSPMFESKVGIDQQSRKFQNRVEFEKKWDEVFEKNLRQKFETTKQKFTQEQKEALRLYDFIMYHTLLSWVYKTRSFEEAITKDVKDYMGKLRSLFNLSFLDEKKKLAKLADNYQKLSTDIFFFQEFSPDLKAHLERSNDYWIETDHPKEGAQDTLIMAKKRRFQGQRPKDTHAEKKKMSPEILNSFEKDLPKTSFMFISKFVLISVHLSSKEQLNKREVDLLLELLPKVASTYPDCHVICGGDVNSFYGPDRSPSFSHTFKMYPNSPNDFTTIKQRTKTQAQWHKADKRIQESKDKIMSDLQILSGKIVTISGDETRQKSILPSDDHPFDHFAVVTTLNTSKV